VNFDEVAGRYEQKPASHVFYWLGYKVTEAEYALLWSRLEPDPVCRAARYGRHLAHKVVDFADWIVRTTEKKRAERILGRKLLERV